MGRHSFITIVKLERLLRLTDCFYFDRYHTKEKHTV